MIPVKHIDPDDLPLYAMHLLPDGDMSAMSEDLQGSTEARRVLSEIYGGLSLLAHTAEMQTPPALARQRFMKNVARERKIIPIDSAAGTYAARAAANALDESPAKKSVAAKVLPWVGWALAAGMVLPLVNFYRQRQGQGQELQQLHAALASDQSEMQQTQAQLQKTQYAAQLANTLMETVKDSRAVHVTLTGSDLKPPPQGRASYVAAKGSLVFLASNLNPIQPGKTYELWLIPANGGNPIAAGTFRPDLQGYASVILPKLPHGVEAKAFGITIEDAGGSITPTAPILLKGAAS